MTPTHRPPVQVIPVEGIGEVRPGDDLAAMLEPAMRRLELRDHDVVVVTSKIVSKAEGRLVSDADRQSAVAAETVRIVARRGDLVIAETAHGFVCANAGVDASNVDAGSLALLPDDPDGTARYLRTQLSSRLGLVHLGVVITDTFGRAWRTGVVNVAIGCDGLPPLVDLRGRSDDRGRGLEATEVALADEVAGASGLVIAKDAHVPAAIVRGIDRLGGQDAPASTLVRPATEDLFRASPLQALHDRRTVRAFGSGDVPAEAIEEAILAACTAPAPHHTRPWRFSVLISDAARRRYLAAMEAAWRADLETDGIAAEVIDRRIARSNDVLVSAPVLIVPWLSLEGSHSYVDDDRAASERDMFVLSGGAAIQNLLVGLSAQGIAGCWISSSIFCREEARHALGMSEEWLALGTVACGPMPPGHTPDPRPPLDLGAHVDRR
ncbi:MAG: coenzyme F420-0:L-glutamate ligase [Actinomycetota bacterium]|nr:coenzyme F420-0:L-glutamate ligase [Actinomycetota bacterium]MDH5313379.1 coenzyme F420-0:L-glutamate ligase [Actinomycetota bacterium]